VLNWPGFKLDWPPLTRAAGRSAGTSIPPLLRQARTNLVANARDLWITGAGTMREQIADLDDLAKTAGPAAGELARAIDAARTATVEFVAWLDKLAYVTGKS
jgi:hypothetical protein